jgi:hypothetical protein
VQYDIDCTGKKDMTSPKKKLGLPQSIFWTPSFKKKITHTIQKIGLPQLATIAPLSKVQKCTRNRFRVKEPNFHKKEIMLCPKNSSQNQIWISNQNQFIRYKKS